MTTQTPQRTRPPRFSSLVPLVRPVLPSFESMEPELRGILASGMVTKGQKLREFEEAVARHLQVEHAVAVSSCTTGLMLAYRALGLSGDVVAPSFTFMATVSALVWAGLRPVFADVDPQTQNLSPEAAERSITPNTTAIVATHIFGNPADVDALQDVADRHGVTLLFDAAHGFGALRSGKPVGSEGAAQAFSMSPTKLLISGEGGVVSTNSAEIAETIRTGREYGNAGDYNSAFAGMNARMPEINALMGLRSLELLEDSAEHRNRVADLYRRELADLPGIGFQTIRAGDRCSYKDFSLTVDETVAGVTRDDVARSLAADNVDTRKYYDPPVHRHTAYRQYWDNQPLPNTETLARRSLSIPLWSNMDEQTALQICASVRDAWAAKTDVRPY